MNVHAEITHRSSIYTDDKAITLFFLKRPANLSTHIIGIYIYLLLKSRQTTNT